MKMIDKFFDFLNLVDDYNENGRFNIMTRWKILHRKSDIYRRIKNKKEITSTDLFNYLFIVDLAKEKLNDQSDKFGDKCSYYINDIYFKLVFHGEGYSFKISCDMGYGGSQNLSLEVTEGDNRRVFDRCSIGGPESDEVSFKVANIARIYLSYSILDMMDDIYKKRG